VLSTDALGTVFMNIVGDPGRAYGLIASTNVLEATTPLFRYDALTFPMPVFERKYASPGQAFYRVVTVEHPSPICNLNLQRISFAKQRIAADNKKRFTDSVSPAEILAYLRIQRLECPSGGSYNINLISTPCDCSLGAVAHHIMDGQPW
jgi:hypothetical protein